MATLKALLGLLVLLYWPADQASAQYLFLDVNGDGVRNAGEALSTNAPASVDVWLQTDVNRDGSRAVSASRDSVPLSIFSYEFILHTTGGTVEWGSYVNLQPSMAYCFGEYRGRTDFYTGYGEGRALPPGKYKLGTLVLRVTAGTPRLEFTSQSRECWWAQTSFGSMNSGKDGLNTLIYTDRPDDVGKPGALGDWGDADGVAAPSISLGSALNGDSDTPLQFGVSVAPNPLNPSATITISTTRTGFIRARLFDVAGRLIGVFLNKDSAPPGRYTFQLNAATKRSAELASGVYYYRVIATEGSLNGSVVVLK